MAIGDLGGGSKARRHTWTFAVGGILQNLCDFLTHGRRNKCETHFDPNGHSNAHFTPFCPDLTFQLYTIGRGGAGLTFLD